MMGYRIAERGGVWHTHHSFGVLLTLLAERVRSIQFHGAQMPPASEYECDFALTHPKIRVTPWPVRENSLQELRHPVRLFHQYQAMVKSGRVVFLRGGGPLLWCCHWMARASRKPVIHWLVSNPAAALASAWRGYGRVWELLGRLYIGLDRQLTRLGITASAAHVLANGKEVARLYRSARTQVVVSTSIRRDDVLLREDTCRGSRIRLLYVGFIRPEKGLEYLLRAMPLIRSRGGVELEIVGSCEQFPAEFARLKAISQTLNLTASVRWVGHVAYGRGLFKHFDDADVFVLPSLSEGTPRVLVEARARGIPVISTNVGGIPTSIEDGVDGILVPPRDSAALARAIDYIIEAADQRRALIRAGRERISTLTLDHFVDRILAILGECD
ncbi:MAG: glycosyltransferase family 4 protein [Phycisphaerales bacterium]|nr:glycosyltransferase family 4 protein [Phycisphaerales bacterium]